jgi:hypothetical protein
VGLVEQRQRIVLARLGPCYRRRDACRVDVEDRDLAVLIAARSAIRTGSAVTSAARLRR